MKLFYCISFMAKLYSDANHFSLLFAQNCNASHYFFGFSLFIKKEMFNIEIEMNDISSCFYYVMSKNLS